MFLGRLIDEHQTHSPGYGKSKPTESQYESRSDPGPAELKCERRADLGPA